MDIETFYMIVTYVLSGLLGVSVGSFLNVVIYRVPLGMSLSKPSSHCPNCNYSLRWYDNIPVVSYLILGGKCRNCKQKISFRYTAVEITNMLAWLLSVALFWKESIVFACIAAITSTLLISVFFIDLENMIIPDRFNILLGAVGILAIFFDPYYKWHSHLLGAAAGFILFYGTFLLFYLILKKEALGGGDIKLALVMGLLLGWQRLALSLLIAFPLAAIVLVLLMRIKGAERGKEYPFGPFLCIGFFISLYFGNYIIDAYLGLFNF